jgi:hypothetical protein
MKYGILDTLFSDFRLYRKWKKCLWIRSGQHFLFWIYYTPKELAMYEAISPGFTENLKNQYVYEDYV